MGRELESSPEPRVLLAGIDTLDFGVFVEFDHRWPKIVRQLAKLKRAARGTQGLVILDGLCSVSPGGKPNYPFLLQFAGFQLYFSRKYRPDGETPNIYVSLNAQTLWHRGVRDGVDEVLTTLQRLAPGTVRECRMSRCDLAADFYVPGGLAEADLRSLVVSRSRARRVFATGDDLETLYIGESGSEVQLRIYDKSLEIVKHDKLWFLPLWGLEGNGNVWRFEFQLRRPFLKSCNIHSLDELLALQRATWEYLTSTWVSLRWRDDANTSRRTIHPLWALVQRAGDEFPAGERLQRRRRAPSLDTQRLARRAASLLVGFGARRRQTDLDSATGAFLEAIRAELSPEGYAEACQRKALQLGVDLREDAA